MKNLIWLHCKLREPVRSLAPTQTYPPSPNDPKMKIEKKNFLSVWAKSSLYSKRGSLSPFSNFSLFLPHALSPLSFFLAPIHSTHIIVLECLLFSFVPITANHLPLLLGCHHYRWYQQRCFLMHSLPALISPLCLFLHGQAPRQVPKDSFILAKELGPQHELSLPLSSLSPYTPFIEDFNLLT